MGLRHDRTRDCGSEVVSCGVSLFPYNFGHIDPDGTTDWGTTMAGGRPFPLLDFFSNPNLDHPDTGQALGVVDRSELIEVSIGGGDTFSTLVANGDSTSNAAWLTASQTVPAGADVIIRAQCADGSPLGDLVECGIDDVKICSN